MLPTGARAKRTAIVIAQALVLVLLAVSPRAILAPKTAYTKAKDSKRPKAPKNVVRAEPLRVSSIDKQTAAPKQEHSAPAYAGLEDGSRRLAPARELPRQAFTQLTKPDYLRSTLGSPPVPFGPPV